MNSNDPISKHVTYGEAIRSETAARLNIPNIPDEAQLSAMKYVAEKMFEPIRYFFDTPIHINSFFRSPALNNSTPGASKTSSHMKGEAIDMSLNGRNSEIFKYVYERGAILDFDQLIWEFQGEENPNEPAWVHVSKVSYRKNRNEILRAYHDQDGNIRYIPFDLF